MPLVGDIALSSVQQIDHVMSAGFQRIAVPGLDGDVLQRAGRGSHGIWIRGVLSGDTAMDDLAKLQKLAAAGTEVSFSTDITVALELEQVVVTDLQAHAVAGTAKLVGYDICLVESPPLPPPAEVSGFGGLDDFGLGDLGFDADIMGDIAAIANDVAGAVDAVMEVADQLSALAALSDIDVGGPLQPLSDAVGSVGGAADSFKRISAAMSELLGGD
ncbi:hypothetical protein CQY20_09230 [Mycolicibacterium agri]|uniref:Uncharacterized protein n=2 Tax=Mycolicibacterium agri TaxID=36811 RepID=A0A2A7N6P6_MYCAG|nr:hypothetical protein CQY20_09230 [Mycolicibacterium agri]GFG52568.1 hypothetical protein MAGR_40090 [Mycolicibacterium agri]